MLSRSLILDGWSQPLPIDTQLRAASRQTFVDSDICFSDRLARQVFAKEPTNGRAVTIADMVRAFRIPASLKTPNDDRIFDALTTGKMQLLRENIVSVGEIAYVMARYPDIMYAHSFHQENRRNSGVRFSILSDVYQEVMTQVPEHEAFAWTLLLRQTKTSKNDVKEIISIVNAASLSFDDIAPALGELRIDMKLLLKIVMHGLDANLFCSLNS